MGLAPYGKPRYKNLIYENLINVSEDGSFELNLDYFDYCTGLTMFNKKFCKLFGKNYRKLDDTEIDIFYMDIAASIQEVIEEIILKICKNLKKIYKIDKICLAGGVALNCVANGKIENEKIFNDIYIQPAAGDAGGALGAALAFWHIGLKKPRKKVISYDIMQGSYLGPSYTNDEIKKFLEKNAISYNFIETDKLIEIVSKLISEKNVIGWFQGKMEFGPRALGNRSILGDPRGEKMQSIINQKVKFREGFRPFAPSILKEKSKEWFDLNIDSPYMLLVTKIKESKLVPHDDRNAVGLNKLNIKRSVVPAITHVNSTARVQTIEQNQNELYYKLIKKFNEITGCPILINTSFNIKDEPIVCSPEDAFGCFLISDIDYLVMGNYLLKKEEQHQENNLEFLK